MKMVTEQLIVRLNKCLPQRCVARLAAIVGLMLSLSTGTLAQTIQMPDSQLAHIIGTATDINGDAVPGATVVIAGVGSIDRRTVVTGENGLFRFDDLKPGVEYEIAISATGFADWTSPAITLQPGQFDLLREVTLGLRAQTTTVTVNGNTEEIATQQIKAEELQRVFGFIPNYYVSYEGDNTAPLTTKMKFELSLKVSSDPVTFAGIGMMAGFMQAADNPDYPQGAKGYGERFGAITAGGLSDIMIGGAILPSLLHQDPRYFYQGTGSTRSRLRHAVLSTIIARGDNGKIEPNYSTVGGDFGSSALANLYYPKSARGTELIFSQFGIDTAERVLSNVAQEFVLNRVTHRDQSPIQ